MRSWTMMVPCPRRSCRSALHDRKRHLGLGDFLADFLLIFWKQHLGFGWFFADFLKATFGGLADFLLIFWEQHLVNYVTSKRSCFFTHFAKTREFLCSDICILSPKFSISDFGRSEVDFLADFLLIFCWFFERPPLIFWSDIADFLNDPLIFWEATLLIF